MNVALVLDQVEDRAFDPSQASVHGGLSVNANFGSLIGTRHHKADRSRQLDRSDGSKVDDQLKYRRLFDRQIPGSAPFSRHHVRTRLTAVIFSRPLLLSNGNSAVKAS